MDESILNNQLEVCSKYHTVHFPTPNDTKLGISRSVAHGVYPIHGLRHPPESTTSGWFVYAGEFSQDSQFFEPIHVAHVTNRCPEILPYLGLPPGWRFLLAQDYVDVWFDESLVKI